MTRQESPTGTPSKDEVEQDFTVPADADLRPVGDQAIADGTSEDDADGAGA